MQAKRSDCSLRFASLAHGAALVGREVVEDRIDPLAVAVAGPDRLERGQGVRSKLALSHDPPQDILADRVAAVELSHPVGLVVVRRDQRRAPRESPPRPGDGADRQRPELVEGETPPRESPKDLLDAAQLGVSLGVVGLLPSLGALKRHAPGRQYLAEPLDADLDHPGLVGAQTGGQLAQAPPRERQPQRLRARRGRATTTNVCGHRTSFL